MDILVRLATEPPDLAGLPAELTGIVTACLDRSPRKRPTSADVLATLAPFVESGSGHGPPSLPGPAAALIAEYQRHPQPHVQAGVLAADESSDGTFGSHTGPPAPRRFTAVRLLSRRGATAGPAGGTTFRPPSRTARRRRRAVTVVALAGGAAVLVAGGAALGAAINEQNRPAGTSTSGVLPSGPPGVPTNLSATPELQVNQSFGDGNTVFVLHGSGLRPGLPVTVTLAGRGTSPDRPFADRVGTFNYAINQAHEFFRGQLPAGHYLVVVSQSGVPRLDVRFQVGQGPPGPPGGRPPGGPPPGGGP